MSSLQQSNLIYFLAYNTMTLTTITDKSLLDQLFAIIKRRQDWGKEWQAIEKLEAIYADELKAIGSQLHTTADGSMILIQNMTDEHLTNTIKLILRRHKGNFKQIPKVYLNEAKRRPWMLDDLIKYEPVIEIEERPFDLFDDDEAPFWL